MWRVRVIKSNLIYISNLYCVLLVLNPSPFTCGVGVEGGLQTGAAPWFRFCLRAEAARIQTSVRVHTLFSGEPLGDPALQHATLLRPVREQGAGHGGDFSFCPDRIFLQLRSFGSFTRSADSGGLKSARRSGLRPCAARWWPWSNPVISLPFSPTSASTKLRRRSLTCGSFPASCSIRPVIKVPGPRCSFTFVDFELFFFSTFACFSGGSRGIFFFTDFFFFFF